MRRSTSLPLPGADGPLRGMGGNALSDAGGPCRLCELRPPTLLASPASSTMGRVEVGPGPPASAGSQTVANVLGCVTDTSFDASFSAACIVLSTEEDLELGFSVDC